MGVGVIGQMRIVADDLGFGVGFEFGVANGNFFRIPDVILVTKEDNIPRTAHQGPSKISFKTHVFRVNKYTNRKRCDSSEIMQNSQSIIRRTIITDYELVRKPGLQGNRTQLLLEEFLTVECR